MLEAQNITCKRCERDGAAATGITWGGALGEAIRGGTCADCWAEWLEEEVRVINELRLNFMDPKSQTVLEENLRRFLKLES